MPETPKDRIAVRCACGTKLAVPISAVGKNAKCPKCGAVFPITLPATTSAARPASKAAVDDESDSLLDALAKQEQTAEATSSPPQGRMQSPCPKCKTMIPADSKVCTACGYNIETGRSVKAARTGPNIVGKAATAASRLTIGTALSGVGALVGAGVWFGVVVATNFEIGWIAWGIGLLAGLGMKLGYRSETTFAGLVAAGMSILGVLAAKIMMFAYVFYPLLNYDPNSIEAQREEMAGILAEEIVSSDSASTNGAAKGVDEDEDEVFDAAYEKAENQVKGMSDDEVRRRVLEYRDARPAQPAGEEGAMARGWLALFFIVCFGWMDILFVLLAVGTAYKLASGGGSA